MHGLPNTHFAQDAYLEWQRQMTLQEHTECLEAEQEAGARCGHESVNSGRGLICVFVCSCGWQGTSCWNDPHRAYAQWVGHLIASGAGIEYPAQIMCPAQVAA
jgi:hypothetical protein